MATSALAQTHARNATGTVRAWVSRTTDPLLRKPAAGQVEQTP
jgi:hypothetical protein